VIYVVPQIVMLVEHSFHFPISAPQVQRPGELGASFFPFYLKPAAAHLSLLSSVRLFIAFEAYFEYTGMPRGGKPSTDSTGSWVWNCQPLLGSRFWIETALKG